ncbi:hypothetical protein ABBQ38_000804 [Trebouxia sp. C0009 RCD-2024]
MMCTVSSLTRFIIHQQSDLASTSGAQTKYADHTHLPCAGHEPVCLVPAVQVYLLIISFPEHSCFVLELVAGSKVREEHVP